MKKRQQWPNAQTYTILLSGLSGDYWQSGNHEKAMKIYESLHAPNARTRPNVAHANAVMKVCHTSRNIDAALEIFRQLPKEGMMAPDRISYTTLFNLARTIAVEQPRRAASMVKIGLSLWSEVLDRWRSNNLEVDDQLACCAAELFLCGEVEHATAVYLLLEEVFGVPLPPNTNLGESKETSDFPKKGLRPRITGHTLEAALTSCSKLLDKESARYYWKYMTSGTAKLERQHFHSYLRTMGALDSPELPQQITSMMLKSGISPNETTMFLLLRSCMTHSPANDLRLAQAWWDRLAEFKLAPNGQLLSTFAKFVRKSRDLPAKLHALSIVRKYQWDDVYRIAQDTPHAKQRVKEALTDIAATGQQLLAKSPPVLSPKDSYFVKRIEFWANQLLVKYYSAEAAKSCPGHANTEIQ